MTKTHIREERIVFLQEFLSTVISGGSEASHIHQKGFGGEDFFIVIDDSDDRRKFG